MTERQEWIWGGCKETTENGGDNRVYTRLQNLLNNKETARLSGHRLENEIQWISMKGFDFLWESDPSCSKCRLNSGCLQSKGNSHGRLEPCCFHEKEETGPTQIQPRTAAHGPVWAGGRPTETSSDNERSAERSAHMWLPTEQKQRFPFFSFLFCVSYLGAKSQREEVREYTENLPSTIFFPPSV